MRAVHCSVKEEHDIEQFDDRLDLVRFDDDNALGHSDNGDHDIEKWDDTPKSVQFDNAALRYEIDVKEARRKSNILNSASIQYNEDDASLLFKRNKRRLSMMHKSLLVGCSVNTRELFSTKKKVYREFLPIAVPLCTLIGGCYALPAVVLHDRSGLVLTKGLTSDIKFLLILSGLSFIPVSSFLTWGTWKISKSLEDPTMQDDVTEKETHPWFRKFIPGQTATLLSLTVMLYHMIAMTATVVKNDFQKSTETMLQTAMAFTLFSAWISALDDAHGALHSYADKLDLIAEQSVKTTKWCAIMKAFSRFGDFDVDSDYCIPGGSRSPARALAEVACTYVNIGKFAGFIMLLLFFIGIDLYSNLVIIGLTVFLTGSVSALHLNEAISNLFPLALSNAFHVGEIISVARTGFVPGDSPETSLTGFVEGVTWSHVVIRDFKKKQTFVPHEEFAKMTIANWSRRPAKLCHFRIAVAPGLSGGASRLAQLAKFARTWMEEHPQIDQACYKKSVMKVSPTQGQILEAIFYPKVGEKARVIRSEFQIMIMDAAKRLDLCLTPVEVRTSSAWVETGVTEDYCANESNTLQEQFSDLMPSDKLTSRAGFKPKKD